MEKVYVFGAGSNGKELLSYIKKRNIADIVIFIDNDIDKQNRKINGIECISIEEAIKQGAQHEIILISPDDSTEVIKRLSDLKFEKIFYIDLCMRKYKYFEPIVLENTDYVNAHPFNHYESPYPDIVKIHEKERDLFNQNKEVLDIDFNIDRQLELISEMGKFNLPGWSDALKNNEYRYCYHNDWFLKESADALYYLMRIIKPNNIIEVGSGYSTAVMLDVNERYFNNAINIVSIEPWADRLKALLKPSDNLMIIENNLQEISLDLFETLEENDILFIDSSHVSKIDSDVNYLLFEIFPHLKKGVYIHFHDIFYPFMYPKEWIYEGRAYNEIYILRAFLMNNKNYSIQFFGSFLERKCSDRIPDKLRGCGNGSLWIRKESYF